MEPIILSYQEPDHLHHYELRRTEESALLGGKSENALQVFFTLGYSAEKDLEGNQHFEYKVIKRNQTNQEGLHEWADDLSVLTDNLLLGVSLETGRIAHIYNQEKIYNQWIKKIWYETRRKHKDEKNAESMLDLIDSTLKEEEKLVHSLCYAPPFSLLFAGIHGMPFINKKSNTRKSRLNGMVGTSYLTIEVDDEISVNENNLYEVLSEGKIDKKKFDKDNFRNFVRTLSDDPTAVSQINTKHTERYLFDETHWVKQAMWLNLSVVPDFMMREERALLKEVKA
jgi:hypothetical protein